MLKNLSQTVFEASVRTVILGQGLMQQKTFFTERLVNGNTDTRTQILGIKDISLAAFTPFAHLYDGPVFAAMFFLAHLLQLYAEGRGGHIGRGLGG
jgi:hypothetical protein